MIAPVSNVPYGPGFVMVNVPWASSSTPSFFDLARVATSRIARANSRRLARLRIAEHRHDQTLTLEVDRDAQIDVSMHNELVIAH